MSLDWLCLRHVLVHALSSLVRYYDTPTILHAHLSCPFVLQQSYPLASLYDAEEPIGMYKFDCGSTCDADGVPDRNLRYPFRDSLEY